MIAAVAIIAALAPTGFTPGASALLPRVSATIRAGHAELMATAPLSFDTSAIIAVSIDASPELFIGVLALGAAGTLLQRTATSESAPSNSVAATQKIAALKREGAAVIARREAVAAAPIPILAAATTSSFADQQESTFKEIVANDVEAVFNSFDKNQDGSLDRYEIKEALEAAGRPADDATVDKSMEALDTNKDGKVSLKEFKAAPRELAWWEKGVPY